MQTSNPIFVAGTFVKSQLPMQVDKRYIFWPEEILKTFSITVTTGKLHNGHQWSTSVLNNGRKPMAEKKRNLIFNSERYCLNWIYFELIRCLWKYSNCKWKIVVWIFNSHPFMLVGDQKCSTVKRCFLMECYATPIMGK